ncbi:Phosphoglucomutase [Porphyromonas macacae]|uniref:Phosphoglucomutase n=1 Tax=Porphyromonas macacae TaxID=28115 RepID=A0A379EG82_9PORP|nr:Phosphoglucomutase [Porphyromonas macacae]
MGFLLKKVSVWCVPESPVPTKSKAMMKGYRNEPMTEIAGSKVKERLDYARLEGYVSDTGDVFTLDMPTTSNVLQFMTEDGTKLSIRPSGTEPKIKYYIGVRQPVSGREDLAEAEKICAGKNCPYTSGIEYLTRIIRGVRI